MHNYYLNIYIHVCLYFKENEGDQGFPLILHYDELCNYFIIYHGVIRIEIKCAKMQCI